MPCSKCSSDFNLRNWKLRCIECESYFCNKCLHRIDGFRDMYCDVCEVLIKRPPVRARLMELKPKDLQHYLNKHHISTHGICEKQELVELFFKNQIPVRHKKCQRKFSNAFSGSVPNLAARSQTYFNTFRNNAEAVLSSHNWIGRQSANSSPQRSPQSPPERVPSRPDRPAPAPPQFSAAEDPPELGEVPLASVFHDLLQQQQEQQQERERQTESPTTSTTQANVNVEARPDPSPVASRKFPKLSDYKSVDDLTDLSVKQLKELLTLNRVDYKGCVEKAELLERANRLWNDTYQRKERENGDEGFNLDECCKICMDAPLDCVLLECGHMATCIDCGKRLAECPICRQYVTRVVRTFKA